MEFTHKMKLWIQKKCKSHGYAKSRRPKQHIVRISSTGSRMVTNSTTAALCHFFTAVPMFCFAEQDCNSMHHRRAKNNQGRNGGMEVDKDGSRRKTPPPKRVFH